jgi:predicted AlkP superfamily phosphohydrolase/phosphomutase
MTRVLVIGIDGATFDLIGPWVSDGVLPTLARLVREGTSGTLTSTLPPVTSPAWPTFATGVNPGKHGVFDFVRPLVSHLELVNSTSIRAPTLWRILSEAGLRVGIINVPVTYPPTPVNGFLVSGLLAPSAGRISFPADLLAGYRAQLGTYRIAPRVQFKDGEEAAFLADLKDLVTTRGEYALALDRDYPSDFLMVHFQATDVLQHAMWKHLDPSHSQHDPHVADSIRDAVLSVYRTIDAYIGRLLDAAGDDIVVFVMSDHGFGPLEYVVNLNLHLLKTGLLRLRQGVWTQLKSRLFQAGLTPATVWRLVERAGLQDYVWRISKATRDRAVSRMLSFDDVDWEHTIAYSIGHVGQVYFNLRGREPMGILDRATDLDNARTRLLEALSDLCHPDTGRPLVTEAIWSDTVSHGPYTQFGPDLHIVLDDYRAITFPLFAADNNVFARQIRGDSGSHRRHGILVAWGKDIQPRAPLRDARIEDIAPTVLHILGQSIPNYMDGRVLVEALQPARAVTHLETDAGNGNGESALPKEDLREVEARLRALGYLG